MPVDSSGGFLLSLLTESFAVRALLGSVAAALLSLVVVRQGWVTHRGARRTVVVAPVLVAAAAAIAVAREGGVYLPQLWLASSGDGPAGQLLEFLGELRVVTTAEGVNLLVSAYAVVAGLLLARRVAGLRHCARLLRGASAPHGYGHLVPVLHDLSARMGITVPRLLLLEDCPGGAFTTGIRRPVVVIDPELVDRLDARELEGVLAHELAHIARRDTALSLAVGVFRDLTFFLPPIHLAQRWLRREQEESADELASEHTRRPVSLASGILKVWDRSAGSVPAAAAGACAVVGTAAPAREMSEAVRAVAVRVERLIEREPVMLPPWRRRAETLLAGGVVLVAVLAAILVPRWIASDLNAYSLSFVYLSAPTQTEVETPAFATFRALTPERAGARFRPGPSAAPVRMHPRPLTTLCPCVESPLQLRAGLTATAEPATPRMLWSSRGHDAWELRALAERTSLRSRPLLTFPDSDGQVGFFLVAQSPRR